MRATPQRSEKGTTASEAQPGGVNASRPRGQVPGGKGHGRTARPLLPVIEEMRTLPPEDRACPDCKLPFAPFPGTEDSEIVEIHVGAYVERQRDKCSGSGEINGMKRNKSERNEKTKRKRFSNNENKNAPILMVEGRLFRKGHRCFLVRKKRCADSMMRQTSA